MGDFHPSAIIDDGAVVGKNTKIWHWTHVSSTAIIGASCTLGQNVYIADGVTIGNNVKIQNNVSVYTGVVIEDDVFCGPSVVFTNVRNPRAAVSRTSEFKITLIRKGATLGANATIVCGVEINAYAFVAAGAVIAKPVKQYALMAGVPAIQIGWMSAAGERLDLPLVGSADATCPRTGEAYQLKNGSLARTN